MEDQERSRDAKEVAVSDQRSAVSKEQETVGAQRAVPVEAQQMPGKAQAQTCG